MDDASVGPQRRQSTSPERVEEVRCRRLVVVDDDGFERVVIDSGRGAGQVGVFAGAPGQGAAALLFGVDTQDGEGATVGFALVERGEARVMLDLVDGHEPALWIVGADDEPGQPA
jgi:hypothetical protein